MKQNKQHKNKTIWPIGFLEWHSFLHYNICHFFCCRYITALSTAASGYSYWHYGRKTVEVLNRSPWRPPLEARRTTEQKHPTVAVEAQITRGKEKDRLTDGRSSGALKPSNWDNSLWVSVVMIQGNQVRPQMVYCSTTESQQLCLWTSVKTSTQIKTANISTHTSDKSFYFFCSFSIK